MNLYLVPNNPEHTTFVSATGVPKYRVMTSEPGKFRSPAVTRISRPADTAANSIVADIEWRRWRAHPVVRSHVFDGTAQKIEVRELLYKLGSTFSTARYFLGNDNEEYRWKFAKGSGYILTHRITGTEVARHTHEDVCEGYFCGERRWCLQLRPSALDIDLIILTFIILEKRRLDKADEVDSDEDPAEAICEGGTEMACG